MQGSGAGRNAGTTRALQLVQVAHGAPVILLTEHGRAVPRHDDGAVGVAPVARAVDPGSTPAVRHSIILLSTAFPQSFC